MAHVRIFEDAAYLAQLNRAALAHLRAIIAISAAVEAEIRRFETLKKVTLYRIYDSYTPATEDVAPSPAGRIANRIACVGRIVPIKGQDTLVRALHGLANSNDAVECLMVGEGEQRFVDALKQLAFESGVQLKI